MLPLLMAFTLAAPETNDWPQWMGPTRDNVWHAEGILEKFPKGGPKVDWRVPINGGYSGPAVAGGKLFIMDYISQDNSKNDGNFDKKPVAGTERFLCHDLADGKLLWKVEKQVEYRISYPAGPRCTPLVHGDKVYFLGAMGRLTCCETASGKIVWDKELTQEYNCKPALWGYAAHPVIDGDKLITLGGIDGNHVIALDKNTGKELWKSGSQTEQGYSPVQFATLGGVRQIIAAGPNFLRGLNPETGEKLWQQEYDATSGSIIMTPVVLGDHIYIGGYKSKNLLVKITAKDGKPVAETVWRNKKDLGCCPVNVQPFVADGIAYSYEDDGSFIACELPGGKRLWKGVGPLGGEKIVPSATAFIVKNGDRFFFFSETGDLVIGKLTKEKYEEIDRAKLLEPTGKAFGIPRVWCMPAFAGKKMYVRNDKELICVDLSK